MRVFYHTNIPSPYRMDFLNELGKQCQLTEFFEGTSARDRDAAWFTGKAEHFTCVFMKGRQTGDEQYFCPEILRHLRRGWDRIILSGYSSPTVMLAIEYLRLRHISFYIELDGGMVQQESRLKYLVKRHFAGAASGWFSSGRATTEFITHYGADPARCYQYPFSSLLERDLVEAVQLAPEDLACLAAPPPGLRADSLEDIRRWSREDYIARRALLRRCARKRLGLGEGPMLLSVGQIIPRKGHDILLRALSALETDCTLCIVGGEATPQLEALLSQLSLTNVRFIPFVDKKTLSLYYRAADLFVLATRFDIWGLVINEAMAQGLGVITTRRCVAGVELVEEGENGFLVEAEDAAGLARQLNRLLPYPQLQARFGERGYRRMMDCTIEQMARRHYEILSRT